MRDISLADQSIANILISLSVSAPQHASDFVVSHAVGFVTGWRIIDAAAGDETAWFIVGKPCRDSRCFFRVKEMNIQACKDSTSLLQNLRTLNDNEYADFHYETVLKKWQPLPQVLTRSMAGTTSSLGISEPLMHSQEDSACKRSFYPIRISLTFLALLSTDREVGKLTWKRGPINPVQGFKSVALKKKAGFRCQEVGLWVCFSPFHFVQRGVR